MRHIRPAYNDDQGPFLPVVEVREKLQSALAMIEELVPIPVPRGPAEPVTEQAVRSVLKARRNRDKHFPSDLFADPAWDMLLELYAAAIAQRRMSVSSLCSGAAVPATTALRWIRALERNDLLVRTKDPFDARRVFVALSGEGRKAMRTYFESNPVALT